MENYKIIKSESHQDIQKVINEYLEDGYQLNGPLYVFKINTDDEGVLHLQYVQSVVYEG